MKYPLLAVVAALLLNSCAKRGVTENVSTSVQSPLKTGIWRMTFDLSGKTLPVNFDLQSEANTLVANIYNGSEKIQSLPFLVRDDSVFFRLPIFESEFKARILNSGELSGAWFNYSRCCGYNLPIHAVHGQSQRFMDTAANNKPLDVAGKWKVTFSPGTEDQYMAIGLFEQKGQRVTGTFLTETGDYRYLDGNANNNGFSLSCFDGSHAFLFESNLKPGSSTELQGTFYSGKHWKEPWIAVRDEQFELTNPDSLTFIKPGYNGLSFTFPNLNRQDISFPSAAYENKVVIVQIMGSWCPNCMDETAYLKEVYGKYHAKGLEIISLCFERSDDFEIAAKNVANHRNHLQAPWEFLIAGNASKDKAAEVLPMLNHVMSFPTSIFIDRRGLVRKIHTGFYGPGTGSYYDRFVEKNQTFIEKLLSE
jgi:thiol-disulfide isomerase/thioredoxin